MAQPKIQRIGFSKLANEPLFGGKARLELPVPKTNP